MSAADLRRPVLTMVNLHYFTLGAYRINHRRLAPASWVVTRHGHHVSEHGTLRGAIDSLRGAA